jgi:thymidylate kinase
MNNKQTDLRTMLVSFSGIDGAGKSTQIANLQNYLERCGVPVRLITFWDDVATLKPLREGAGHKVFKGDKGVGSPDAPIERRDKNVQSPIMSLVRMAIYFLDALSLRRKAKRALRTGSGIVIFDRYLYDELANLNLQNAALRFYARLLMRLVPRPAVSFVIDADPVLARARKPEYPLEFLHTNRNSYLRLSLILGGLTVIAPASLDQMKSEVVECVRRNTIVALQQPDGQSVQP